MPKFCANISWLFQEFPLLNRIEEAAEAGFGAVEILNPYETDVQAMVQALGRWNMTMALINCPPPNYTGGARGFAAVPGVEDRFRRDFKRALRYARTLKAGIIHVMAGEASGPDAHQTYVENLRWAAAEAGDIVLTIEPLNPRDFPGYFLNDFYLARDVLVQVDMPNVQLQFDAYHAGQIHGDVPSLWADLHHLVAHVQIAQTPDRTEPVGGPIDFPSLLSRLDADGYQGWVAAEYGPVTTTKMGLGWMTPAP